LNTESPAIPLALTSGVEEEALFVPSTPAPPSSNRSDASSPENAVQRLLKCHTPRHFLISEKRTTPKGFKQLQKRPDIVTSDHKPFDSLGDGFSDYEAVPTGVAQVGGKRKPALPSVALGQLELTQTTNVEPVEKQKTRRFTRTRKRDRREDDPFDFADVQLAPRILKRLQQKALNDDEIRESPLGRSRSPVLGGVDERVKGQDVDRPQAAEVDLLESAGYVKTSGPCERPLPEPAAADGTIPATVVSYQGETMPSEMELSAEAWGTYEVSQTPVVLETQFSVLS
jgi:hypothetical protein